MWRQQRSFPPLGRQSQQLAVCSPAGIEAWLVGAVPDWLVLKRAQQELLAGLQWMGALNDKRDDAICIETFQDPGTRAELSC